MKLLGFTLIGLACLLVECFATEQSHQQTLVSVKIIEEPAQNILMNYAQQNPAGSRSELLGISTLKPKYRPAPFSGPSHFEILNGKCFEHMSQSYRWTVCPFQNVTQIEDELKWNAFKGVLGVWYEWEIENGTLTSMLMLHGESCGINGDRQVKLKFVCDNGDDLIKFESITEPQICKYEILLKTPLVCSQFSLNVYPTLNRTLQHEWDLAYSEYSNQLITEKMYMTMLDKIYEKAGLKRTINDTESLKIAYEDDEEDEETNKDVTVSPSNNESVKQLKEKLNTCEQEKRRLESLLVANRI